MRNFYVTSALLTIKNSQVIAIFDSQEKKTQIIANKSWLILLEIFIHEHSLEAAYQRFQQIYNSPISEQLLHQCIQTRNGSNKFYVLLDNQVLKISTQERFSFINIDQQSDFSVISQETSQVLLCLFNEQLFTADESKINSFDNFSQTVKSLRELGLLSPALKDYIVFPMIIGDHYRME